MRKNASHQVKNQHLLLEIVVNILPLFIEIEKNNCFRMYIRSQQHSISTFDVEKSIDVRKRECRFVWITHYSLRRQGIMLNYSEKANQSNCLKHQINVWVHINYFLVRAIPCAANQSRRGHRVQSDWVLFGETCIRNLIYWWDKAEWEYGRDRDFRLRTSVQNEKDNNNK